MMCTVSDCSVEASKKGKQINKAMIYELSINYKSGTSIMYNMCMDFIKNSFNIVKMPTELPLRDSLNFLMSVLSK